MSDEKLRSIDKLKAVITALQWVGIPALGIIFAYGANRATNATRDQDITMMKAQMAEILQRRTYNEERFVTRVELKANLDAIMREQDKQTRTLERIDEALSRGK